MRFANRLVGIADVPVYRAGMENTPPKTSPKPLGQREQNPASSILPEEPAFWFRIFNEIGIINQLASTLLEAALPNGLKAADFRLLNHFVRLGGPRTPVELARSFQVTKGTMTHTVQKMSALGMVTLVPNGADGRSKWVDITDAGREAHAKTMVSLLPDMERAMAPLQGGEKSALQEALPALVALREALDKARD